MKVLVVGGTGFLGGALASAAEASGLQVTVLTRGLRPAVGRPDGVRHLVSDRHVDLSVLRGLRFDAVVDTCAFAPSHVARLLDHVATDRYVFVSSASVYADFRAPGITEDWPTKKATSADLALAEALPMDRRASAEAYGDAYGALKREAELVAMEQLGDRALVVRSGLLVGPRDYSDRLTYWVRRIDLGGNVLVVGAPERPVQMIDMRDAAAFIVRAVLEGRPGIMNLVGRPMAFGALLETCNRCAGGNAAFVWIDDETALAAGLQPWSGLPLWVPWSAEPWRHFLEMDTSRAHAAGLRTRPVAETIRDIIEWDRGRRPAPLRVGLEPDKEADLIRRAAGNETGGTSRDLD